MKKLIFFAMLYLLIITSCSRRYSRTNYQRISLENKTLAVLPYDVVTTGRIPDKISPEELEKIEAAESHAFQVSLYHQMLNQLDKRNHRDLGIKIQHFEETNNRLEKAGKTPELIKFMTAEELATVLGVDAVINSSVHKTQYLTNLESYGVYLARHVTYILSSHYPWYAPSAKTSDVRISTTIIDSEDGTAIWAASQTCPTDWRANTYDIIEKINYRISKRIPY